MKVGFFAAVLLLSLPAEAAMLWFGGEDTSGLIVGTVVAGNSQAGSFDVNFARGHLTTLNGATAVDPAVNYVKTPTFAAAPIIWVHGNVWVGNNLTNTANQHSLWVSSPDGVGRVYLRQTGTAGQLKLSTANAARTFSDKATATGNLTVSTLQPIDWLIDYSCSVGSVTQLYIAGVKVIDYTGSLCTDAAATLNQAAYAGFNQGSAGSTCGSTNLTCWSELLVASEDTRGMRVAVCALQAAGTTQGWTPSTLANVNKAVIADGTFVSDVTGNVLSQWTCPMTAPAGTWYPRSQAIEARMQRSGTGPQNFDFSRRISGADYLAGTVTAPLSGSFSNFRHQADISPATGTNWAIGEIYNTSTNQLNIGVKSLP